MTPARRQALREIMQLAWSLYRAELKGPNPRTFADALAGAWRFAKRLAQAEPARLTGHVRLNTMVRSPIRRRLGAKPYANTNARDAGYVTSVFGR